jgi:aryl-alcohol dehydrogenase-like predicted oxidoreductase
MARQPQTLENNVELADIPGTSLRVSRIAIGTWAIGGWMWGGTDEAESVSTIHAAVDHGINVIDTAPIYGFGRSEEIVGKAIAEGRLRSRVLIATKVGLEWRDGKIFRNSSRDRINHEIEESLQRLRTDHVDIYQIHWPDPLTPIGETAEAMHMLYKEGKIRAIGVSNFSIDQMEQFRRFAPIHVLQPPYNLFERGIEAEILPYAAKTRLRLSVTARCAGAFCPDGCGRTRFSAATTCAVRTRNSGSPASINISPPCNGSIVSPRTISANASFTWRSAGCSIKASPRPFGAHAIPVNWSRSTSYSAGRSMLPSKPRSTGS